MKLTLAFFSFILDSFSVVTCSVDLSNRNSHNGNGNTFCLASMHKKPRGIEQAVKLAIEIIDIPIAVVQFIIVRFELFFLQIQPWIHFNIFVNSTFY